MVEMIVVLVLVGILGAVGVSRFFERSEYTSLSFADQAAAALRFAQKEAIAQNRPVFVRFDGESIRLCFASGPACAADKRVPAPFSVITDPTYCTSPTWYCVLRPSSVSYTISWGAISAAAPRFLSFDALGQPFNDATPAQAASLTLSVIGKGTTAQVQVAADTGYVY
jgi:MSHA pilin protein MshC